jgi:hypothetical protein
MRARLLIGVLAAVAATVSGCAADGAAGSGSVDSKNWLVNSQDRTYVEIPPQFKRFNVNPFRVNKFDLKATRVAGIERTPGSWEVVFDSAQKPKVDNFDDERPSSLVGSVAVYTLNSNWRNAPNFRDSVSVGVLRSYPFGTGSVDPVALFNDGRPEMELISYSEVAGKNGIRGVKVRFNLKLAPSTWVTVDQQAFANRDTTKLYVLTMKCSSTCFKKNYDTVRKISSSFTVQK